MAREQGGEQGGEQAPAPVAAERAARRPLAVRLRALEAKISASPAVAGAVLSLSAPDEPALEA
jgi:hypothetical protein